MTTVGSLFTGYGGLDMGVMIALDSSARIAWTSDVEPGPCKLAAVRWPDTPNLGDITRVDWDAVEPVDIICGGSPCQDISVAGKRAGMAPGTRVATQSPCKIRSRQCPARSRHAVADTAGYQRFPLIRRLRAEPPRDSHERRPDRVRPVRGGNRPMGEGHGPCSPPTINTLTPTRRKTTTLNTVRRMAHGPDGHVTGTDLALPREQQLRLLGNGVVPQQAALAVRTLTETALRYGAAQ